MFIPAPGQFERDQYRAAVEQWVASGDFQLHVVLTFNRSTTYFAARNRWGEWLQGVDTQCPGRSCQKQPNRGVSAFSFFKPKTPPPPLHFLRNFRTPPATRRVHGRFRIPPRLAWHSR